MFYNINGLKNIKLTEGKAYCGKMTIISVIQSQKQTIKKT